MKELSASERQARAIHAAQSVAVQHGVPAQRPVILKDTNHTIVHLEDRSLVAKVSVQRRFRHLSSSLEREVLVARILAEAGAPVARPSCILPPGPHYVNGVELTFWDFYPHDPDREVSMLEAARSLRIVHEVLKDLQARLPTLPVFTLQINEAESLLRRPENVPRLPERDRLFLRNLHKTIKEKIGLADLNYQPLHGECHLRQAVASTSGILWLDFEAACMGPKEWDLVAFDDESIGAYGTVDPSLVALLRTARLFCIVTWCWTQPDRAPEVREAAEYHLAHLKKSG
jgi:Phosphotransferase enzyme family